jgi:hypothetical protein
MHATCPTRLILLDLVTLMTLGEKYKKLWDSPFPFYIVERHPGSLEWQSAHSLTSVPGVVQRCFRMNRWLSFNFYNRQDFLSIYPRKIDFLFDCVQSSNRRCVPCLLCDTNLSFRRKADGTRWPWVDSDLSSTAVVRSSREGVDKYLINWPRYF